MARSRRELLQFGVLSAVTAIAGCLSDNPATDTPPETGSKSPTPEPTTTVEPTQTPEPTAEDQLPVPKGDWKLIETDGKDWRMLGGKTGIIGTYKSPTGTLFKVVIMEVQEGYNAETKAERWACIGWDVAVAYQGYAFAAGTGTDQQTFTPEKPPHMTRTPVPDSADESRELLSYSPLLSDQIIRDHRQSCSG